MSRARREEQKLNEFWAGVKEQAMDRGDTDCPICFNPFVNYKKTSLLDCSHMYHANCLQNFEKYDTKERNEIGDHGHSCPMCRHPNYKKIDIDHDSMLVAARHLN